jgi:hypothetical protein
VKSSTNHGEIAPIARAYFDLAQNAVKSLKSAFPNMALRVRVVPALAGSLSSTFWVRKASGTDKAPMPAALATAQPRADATSCVDAEASKGMRMAQAKAIRKLLFLALVSKFFKPMSAEQKAVHDARQSAKYAEERLQREERKQQQLA